ncbi:MAG: excinuclease ABC subunit UvrC [Anaerolineaceae bacterium]|jgi:excinuclease ABC subunit C|nr:excinuclease ABC subunit UvrC [Anaerolineaceae bacterium]
MRNDLYIIMLEISEKLQGILDTLPLKPGCYLMKNKTGNIIYVGKAINLRHRVRSYFHGNDGQHPRTRQLVQNITDIEWIVVDSELEALILEMTLIKKHKPIYNIRLKDDKRYPYIKVHWADAFPKITVTRRMVNDGSRYFGPYTSVWAVHQTLDVLRKIFPYLTCDREITGQDKRACLYFDIKLCSAPCIGMINQQKYRSMINDLCEFLDGRTDEIVNRMQLEMNEAAESMAFEKAATIRDQIRAINQIVEKQKVVSTEEKDSDVIALAREDGEACVQIFFIRNGKLIGREYFILEGTEEAQDQEVIKEFLKQFYSEAASIPSTVLLPNDIEEMNIIRQWLNTRRGGEKIDIVVPHAGTPRELMNMAKENAVETLKALRSQWEADTHRQAEALAELQEAFQLSEPPNRIECYDISNTQGTASVGSMVVFTQGVPNRKLYRKFNIKTVEGPDDFASMAEVLTRRFKRWISAQESHKIGGKVDESFALLPDILIVDGGKGQLGKAVEVLEEFNLTGKFKLVGLAKQEEELFFPHRPDSVKLPRNSQGLYLIQRIRDEAHRFAITAHRKRRSIIGLASQLDKVPGIGSQRRKALLNHFGSIEGIINASDEELLSIPGIHAGIVEAIRNFLE